MKRSAKRVLMSLVFFIFFINLGLLLFMSNPLFIASAAKENKIISSENIKLTSYHLPAKIRILSSKTSTDFFLQVIPAVGKVRKIELPGFETECQLIKKVAVGNADILFFQGDVGVHSRNMAAVKITSDKLAIIPFYQDNEHDLSLQSDWPEFNISDGDSLDIEALNRDYEKDPLRQSIKKKFYLSADKFIRK